MNILVIAHYQDDGSPYVSFVHEQVKAYVKLGHTVHVIAPVVFFKPYKYLERRLKSRELDGAVIYYPKMISLSKYGKYNINILSGYLAIKSIINKILKTQNIDIIHAHTIGLDGAVAVKLKKKYDIPVVITTHGSDTIVEVNNGKINNILKICRKADVVVAVSHKLASYLYDSNLDIEIILNGFNQKFTDIAKKEFTIIQVGALIPQKKCDITLKAFAIVKRLYPNSSLLIVGEGSEKKTLETLCSKYKLKDSVKFIGWVPNNTVLTLMSESQIFVMPSINEGLGIVYLEAMGSKCIAIGSKNEGIEDVIVNNLNGFLISADNYKELADCICYCFQNPNKMKEIQEKAFETVNELTWEKNAQQYIDIFTSILSK